MLVLDPPCSTSLTWSVTNLHSIHPCFCFFYFQVKTFFVVCFCYYCCFVIRSLTWLDLTWLDKGLLLSFFLHSLYRESWLNPYLLTKIERKHSSSSDVCLLSKEKETGLRSGESEAVFRWMDEKGRDEMEWSDSGFRGSIVWIVQNWIKWNETGWNGMNFISSNIPLLLPLQIGVECNQLFFLPIQS